MHVDGFCLHVLTQRGASRGLMSRQARLACVVRGGFGTNNRVPVVMNRDGIFTRWGCRRAWLIRGAMKEYGTTHSLQVLAGFEQTQ